jgi:hypothetical protein
MRPKQVGFGDTRGATPALTVVKHQLRDWAEARLKGLPRDGSEAEFQTKLNTELRDADLFCGKKSEGHSECLEGMYLGFLEDLKISRLREFLILQTGVGIGCGFDESAYLYSWSDDGWRRAWQTEQDTYTKEGYKPQRLQSVLISPWNKQNDYMVLTLGTQDWCASNWRDVYYRAFHLGPDMDAAPLVEGSDWAALFDDPPILGSVARDDVLVEYTIASIGGGAREAIRHYKIDSGGATRVDPLALRPRDFVDEWLAHDWLEAAHWSEDANRRAMLNWHENLRKRSGGGEFIDPTMHCPVRPDLWQVGVDFSDPPTPIGVTAKGTYFLVRWRPPYTFRMVAVSDRPDPRCTEEDREDDDELRTLFPGRQRY